MEPWWKSAQKRASKFGGQTQVPNFAQPQVGTFQGTVSLSTQRPLVPALCFQALCLELFKCFSSSFGIRATRHDQGIVMTTSGVFFCFFFSRIFSYFSSLPPMFSAIHCWIHNLNVTILSLSKATGVSPGCFGA